MPKCSYQSPEEALEFLRSQGARWDKRHRDLIVHGPLSLKMLATLDYLRKSRIVVFTTHDDGTKGAVVMPSAFKTVLDKEAA